MLDLFFVRKGGPKSVNSRSCEPGVIMRGTIYKVVMFGIAITATAVALTASVTGQPKPIHHTARAWVTVVSGSIRWSKTYGIIPIGPGLKQAAPSPCGQFYVAATVPSTGKAVAVTSGMTLDPYYRGDYYVCKYSLNVPGSTPLYMIAGLGGSLLLPQIDETPMFLTDAWIGGSYSKPPSGAFRTFTGSRSVNLNAANPTVVVNFEMTYARKDNPR